MCTFKLYKNNRLVVSNYLNQKVQTYKYTHTNAEAHTHQLNENKT